jgi:hypothetical protein
MTHYEKLATMIFRIIGIIEIGIGLVLWIPSAIIPGFNVLRVVFYVLPFLAIGFVFFAFSRPLAKRVCFDFDKFDEQK